MSANELRRGSNRIDELISKRRQTGQKQFPFSISLLYGLPPKGIVHSPTSNNLTKEISQECPAVLPSP